MLGHLGEIFGKFDKLWLFLSADRFQNMRFLEGNSLTGSFSRKFRVQLAKKVKTKSIYSRGEKIFALQGEVFLRKKETLTLERVG